MANLERIYTIPLGKVYEYIRNKRGKRAIKNIREFALRHMKAEEVKISEGVNSAILRDGIQKPPRKIKVRIVKDENQTAKVWLLGEEEKIKEAADKKKKTEDERKKKEEAARKEKTAKAAEKPAAPAAKPAESKPVQTSKPAPAKN
ncbi:MAG: 50S ribosomal protein L31e [Candidatus Micrarchaeota archaeon]|nr:50S ribosomal protein L31e [Candidatus Micrarchaeota archaeon]